MLTVFFHHYCAPCINIMISADRKILEESPIGTWLLLKLSTYQPAESLIPNPSFQSDQFIFQTFVKQPTTWHRDDDSGKLEEMQDKGMMMIGFQNFEANYEAKIWIPDVHISGTSCLLPEELQSLFMRSWTHVYINQSRYSINRSALSWNLQLD